MEVEKFSTAMLLFFKIFQRNLEFRLFIIDVTGKRGQADDIRAATAKIHLTVLNNILHIIAEWPRFTGELQYQYYLNLVEYANEMFENESNALSILEAIKNNLQTKNVPIELIQEAVNTHELILANTKGLLALQDWIKANTPEAYKPNTYNTNFSLRDPKLMAQRETLIDNLKTTHGFKPKPKL